MLGNGVGIPQSAEGRHGCFDHVVRVGRTFGFGQDVGNPGALQNGTHRTTGNNTGTMGGWLDEYQTTTEFSFGFVWDGPLEDRNLDQRFLGTSIPLAIASDTSLALPKP